MVPGRHQMNLLGLARGLMMSGREAGWSRLRWKRLKSKDFISFNVPPQRTASQEKKKKKKLIAYVPATSAGKLAQN